MLIAKTCETCGSAFSVRPYRINTARFCSGSCRATWVCSLPHNRQPRPRMVGNSLAVGNKPNRTSFQPGAAPWNAGMKVIHLSPLSEFKTGRECNRTPIGTVRIRHRNRDNSLRAYIKVAEPNSWRLRAQVVWEATHGPMRRGMVIHHHDRDTLNDDIENLQYLTKAEHIIEHQHDLRSARWPLGAAI